MTAVPVAPGPAAAPSRIEAAPARDASASGTVVDAVSVLPIDGVNVGATAATATADRRCRFTISGLAPGTCTLVARAAGYAAASTEPLDVPSASSANAALSLQPAAVSGARVIGRAATTATAALEAFFAFAPWASAATKLPIASRVLSEAAASAAPRKDGRGDARELRVHERRVDLLVHRRFGRLPMACDDDGRVDPEPAYRFPDVVS